MAEIAISKDSLHGLKVLVPRPRPQGENISNLIEAHGGTVIRFPVIEITQPDNFASLDETLTQLSEVDLIILVSVSAVNGLVARQLALAVAIPANVKVAAVGAKTATQCESVGIKVDFIPAQRIHSEGLLECLSEFKVRGKKIIIFRGQSGRQLLKTELEKLGAKVRHVVCYRRRTTSQSMQPVIDKWICGDINAVLITSVSILKSMSELLGNPNLKLLKKTTVVTISHRIASQCIKAGINDVLVADSPADRHIMEKLESVKFGQ